MKAGECGLTGTACLGVPVQGPCGAGDQEPARERTEGRVRKKEGKGPRSGDSLVCSGDSKRAWRGREAEWTWGERSVQTHLGTGVRSPPGPGRWGDQRPPCWWPEGGATGARRQGFLKPLTTNEWQRTDSTQEGVWDPVPQAMPPRLGSEPARHRGSLLHQSQAAPALVSPLPAIAPRGHRVTRHFTFALVTCHDLTPGLA